MRRGEREKISARLKQQRLDLVLREAHNANLENIELREEVGLLRELEVAVDPVTTREIRTRIGEFRERVRALRTA